MLASAGEVLSSCPFVHVLPHEVCHEGGIGSNIASWARLSMADAGDCHQCDRQLVRERWASGADMNLIACRGMGLATTGFSHRSVLGGFHDGIGNEQCGSVWSGSVFAPKGLSGSGWPVGSERKDWRFIFLPAAAAQRISPQMCEGGPFARTRAIYRTDISGGSDQ